MKNFLLFIFLIPVFSSAQNLVPNPSFEDTIHCPNSASEINFATGWVTPTLGSPDYYNTCSTDAWSSIPCNNYGCQSPHTGNAYAGIFTFTSIALQGNYREYIQCALMDSLISNKKYLVQFFVNLADTFLYECNDIGIYFSSQQISYPLIQSNLQYSPQAKNDTSNILSDKNGWILVSDTFIAIGGEKYLTLGNFKPDSTSSNSLVSSGITWPHSYYLIDDIYVGRLDSGESIQNSFSEDYFSVFPNPCNDFIIIKNNKLYNYTLILYDELGRVIINMNSKNLEYSLNIKKLSDGLYFLDVKTEDKIIYTNKIIVKH